MRRAGAAAGVTVAAVLLLGCGSGEEEPAEAAFPAAAEAAGDVYAGSTEDQPGDAGDPEVDLRSARVEQRGTTLRVHVVLAGPLPAVARQRGAIHVGAYLLRGPDDTDPFAARLVLRPAEQPSYRWGRWLEPGAETTGSVEGREVIVTVPDVPAGRYRYVQFFAESDGGIDIAPDDTPKTAGVVAIDPVE